MDLILTLCIRLVAAACIGALIGYEREVRAKGAGVRTHVMVALGSALFMIVSMYGFEGADKFDASRVAAGVVTGIGFLGAGIIMRTGSHISGLTTAAGLWLTGAIGLGIGGGLYIVSLCSALLALSILEVMHLYKVKMGFREVNVILSSPDEQKLIDLIGQLDKRVRTFSLSRQDQVFRAEVCLNVPKKETTSELLHQMTSLQGIHLESLE